ncbi:MAG: CotH kinase family protein, partial [Flavobacteriaceae bacterium]
IQTYISDFEDALQSENFTDEIDGYKAYIDVASFVDFFILTELGNNVDGYRLSTWLTKDRDEKLKMGPVWDFNLAYGNADYCAAERYDVWAYRLSERCPGDFYPVPFWWTRLMEDPSFKLAVRERYTVLRSGVLSDGAIASKIESYRELLDSSNNAGYNFTRWPILGEWVWPNFFVGQTYNEEVDYLKDWVLNRMAWLDEQIGSF